MMVGVGLKANYMIINFESGADLNVSNVGCKYNIKKTGGFTI